MRRSVSALVSIVLFIAVASFSQSTPSTFQGSRNGIVASDSTCSQALDSQGILNQQTSESRDLLLKASALVKEISESQQYSAAANISAQLTRAGDLPHALATVRMLEKPDEQVSAMGSIGWQLANDGNPEQALALIGNYQDGTGKDFAYTIVSKLFAEKKEFSQALRVARLIKGQDRLQETLLRIAVLQAKTGKRDEATASLAEALQLAEKMEAADPNHAMSFYEVAKTQAEIGETPETSAALSRLSAIAREQENDGRGELLLQFLVSLQAQLGDFAGATQTVQEISGGAADWALGSIAEEYAKRGSMMEALGVASRISDSSNREGTVATIATAGRLRGSSDQSLTAIDAIQNSAVRAQGLANLAFDQAQQRDPATYQTLLLWQTATEGGTKASDGARGSAAVTYAMMGDFANAEQVLEQIIKPEGRSWPLWNLTRFLANDGRMQEAVSLAQHEKEPLPKLYGFLGTAEGLLDRIERGKEQ